MKKDIHPKYGPATVECSCGNKFETRSTLPYIKVEICSACHPLFTGKQKLVDTAGRVDKFRARIEKAKALKASAFTKASVDKQKKETQREIGKEMAREKHQEAHKIKEVEAGPDKMVEKELEEHTVEVDQESTNISGSDLQKSTESQ